MGAVILAAGRGERLAGLSPPFMKPTLLVNGVPLIVQQMQNAFEVTKNITLVLAPENARHIIDLLDHSFRTELDWVNVQIVVQPFPGSVTDALRRGLRARGDEYTVVLMGDNVVPSQTVRRMVDDWWAMKPDLHVATQPMSDEQAQRFTYRYGTGPWVEKKVAGYSVEDLPAEVWVGPLIIKDPVLFIEDMKDSIGETFNCYDDVRTWNCSCSDVGVPEALQ